MEFPVSHAGRINVCFLLCSLAIPASGQVIPSDLEVIAIAGAVLPNSESATVRILSDGQGTYERYLSGDLTNPDPEAISFTLTPAEIAQLWQAIQVNNFFSLGAEYANASIRDRTFARLMITANGTTHTVSTRNIAVDGFDNIVSTINNLTTGDDDLIYDTSEPIAFTQLDICERPGKQSYGPLSKEAVETAVDLYTMIDAPMTANTADIAAHPGTAVAYVFPLTSAVAHGLVGLTAKGEFFGDGVSIFVDNSTRATNNDLRVTLYLELWGPGASASNSLEIKNAIEAAWEGTTTNGMNMMVEVITRTSPGGTSPPGTTGYHQIKMVPDSTITSDVGDGPTPFAVNDAVGSGTWASTGSDRSELYAHEAGHLFGFEDRYDDYRKQADGTWKRESDGKPFTSETLADVLAPQRPDLTKAQIIERLEKPGRQRVTNPKPGFEDDLMAGLKGMAQKGDRDALAALAGLLVEVRGGDTFVNKTGSKQNLAIMRSEDIFVLPGDSKTLEGLYATCIDRSRGTPNIGDKFDLAPSLSEWSGIAASGYLLILLEYLNEQEKFCRSDRYAQTVVWRITNNAAMTDTNATAFLRDAGIDLGYRTLDFPRMSNPNFADPNTSLLTPPQLYVPSIESSTGDNPNVGETITLTAGLTAPSLGGVSATFNWQIDIPDGSSTALAVNEGETTTFSPDVRGDYEIRLIANVTDSSASTFLQDTFASFTAIDALTETFESGTLETVGPFLWKTGGSRPWIVNNLFSHSGGFAAASGDIGDNGTSSLRASFEQIADGSITFAYNLWSHFSDSLLFAVDGEVYGRWNGFEPWSTFSLGLAPGVHTAEWTFKKDGAESIGPDGAFIDDVFFPESAIFTSIESSETDVLPTYRLSGNYPNPFSSTTTITFEIPRTQSVTLVLFDALGRQVAVLSDGLRDRGQHGVRFDARALADGIYFYQMRAGTFVDRRAMIVLK